MDETIRVKIVADTSQASSSLKSLGKQTDNLRTGTNAVNTAVNQLNKTLNSIGFKSVGITNLVRAFTDLKTTSLIVGKTIKSSIGKEAVKATENLINGAGKAPEAFQDVSNAIQDIFDDLEHGVRSTYTESIWGGTNENIQVLKSAFKDLGKNATADVKKLGFAFNQIPYKQINHKIKRLSNAWDKEKPIAYRRAVKDLYTSFTNLTTNTTSLQRALSSLKYRFNKLFEEKTLGGAIKDRFVAFGTGLKTATRYVVGFTEGLIKLTAKLLTGGLIAGLAALFAGIRNVFSVSKLGDDIDKTSKKVGMGTTAFQQWSYILERCGVEVSSLQTAMRGLNSAVINNPDRFSALGIDPNGLSQSQLFAKTVEALQKVSDSTERARLAYQLFGRSSAELAPLLAISGAEVQRLSYQYNLLGATMDGRLVRASANLQDAITDLKSAFQGLKNTLAQALMPIITHIIVRLTVFIAKVNMVLQSLFGVKIEYDRFEESTANVTSNVAKTNTEVRKLRTLIAGFDELNIFPSQDNNNGDIGSFLDDLEDYGNFGGIEPGQILPPEAIAELKNFHDNILPGIVEKLKIFIEKVKEVKAAWDELESTGDTDTFFNRILEITGLDDNPFFKGLVDAIKQVKDWWNENVGGKMIGWDPIDWTDLWGIEVDEGGITDKVIKAIEKINKWFNENFGGGRLFGWDMPDGETFSDWWNNFWNGGDLGLGLDFDFESSPAGKFVKWWNEKALPVLNTNPFEWLDEQLGISEWWEENIGSITWDNIFADIRADYEDSDLKGIVDEVEGFFGGIGTWFEEDIEPLFTKEGWSNIFADIKRDFEESKIGVIFTKEYWQTKFAVIETAIQNVPIVKAATNIWNTVKGWFNKDVNPTLGSQSFWKGKFLIAGIGLDGAALPAKVANVWNSIKTWWNKDVAPKFTSAYWKTKFESIKTGLGNVPIVGKVKETWNSVREWWNKNIAPKFTIAYWKEKFNIIPNGLGYASILTKMREKWAEVKSWWDKNVAPKFTWTYWRDKFNSIKSGLSNVSLVGVAKSMINGLINTLESGLNRIIDKLNGSGILSALRTVGVNVWLNRVYIPRLAKGGIIDEPTMAMMGEYPGARNNPEIVTPERKLTQIFENSNDDIVGVLVQGFRQIISAIDDKDLSVSLGDTQIAKSAARGNNQYRLQTGTSLF